MIYDDYFQYTDDYRQKYGPKTVILMQVGDFFELYAVDNDDCKMGVDMYTVCDLLNLQVSRKNKSILENHRQNPLMAGFPLYILDKHIHTLVDHEYTVVIIRQVTPPPNVVRQVTEIISPGTCLNYQERDHTYLMVMSWDYINKTDRFVLGIAFVDLSTGDVSIHEVGDCDAYPTKSRDEAFRIFHNIMPKEVVFIGNDFGSDNKQQQRILQGLQIPSCVKIHERWSTDIYNLFSKPSYQSALLDKVYNDRTDTSVVTIQQALNIDRYSSLTIALCYLIQFVYEHNECLIHHLKYPTFVHSRDHLTLHYNTAYQLNLLSYTKDEKPLHQILNRCKTAVGSRLFKSRLLQPITRTEILQERYNEIEALLQENLFSQIHAHLKNTFDLERIQRKLTLETLSPCEWVQIDTSLRSVNMIIPMIQDKPLSRVVNAIQSFNNLYENALNLTECSKYLLNDIQGNCFLQGICPQMDNIMDTYNNVQSAMNDIVQSIYKSGVNDQCACKLEYNDKEGHHITITKKRWECYKSMEREASSLNPEECHTRPVSSSSNILKVFHPTLEKFSRECTVLKVKLEKLGTETYKQFLRTILPHAHLLQCISDFISHLDVQCTNAWNAQQYNYCQPHLIHHSKSFICAHDLRHPIIERINEDAAYISNSIELGKNEWDGLLLYGINAAGKSSFMKSIGLTITMAQSGMYVPCSKLEYHPYEHLFTRISGKDNLFAGMSTFIVEMTELRNILQQSNFNSLVLGDELCAGTESVSAISIVASGIHALSQQQSSFVFATHLHDLTRLPQIQALSNIAIRHLHVSIDKNGKLNYDRILRDGNGSEFYGLEVCKSLQMPETFLNMADDIRRQILKIKKHVVRPKKSKYNASVYMDACMECGSTDHLETHHMEEQQHTDDAGFLLATHKRHIHKNHKSNLRVLCKQCHLMKHHLMSTTCTTRQ